MAGHPHLISSREYNASHWEGSTKLSGCSHRASLPPLVPAEQETKSRRNRRSFEWQLKIARVRNFRKIERRILLPPPSLTLSLKNLFFISLDLYTATTMFKFWPYSHFSSEFITYARKASSASVACESSIHKNLIKSSTKRGTESFSIYK